MDGICILSNEDVREEARQILMAIDKTRGNQAAFEDNWRRLWQLLREANAAHLPGSQDGPWSLRNHSDKGSPRPAILAAGHFEVPIWPPEGARRGPDLPGLLNWAQVPIPYAR